MHNRSSCSSPILISDDEVDKTEHESDEEEINELEHLRKLFVGGLHANVTESTLKEYFQKFGKIVEVIVVMDPISKRSKGYGFVTFCKAYMLERVQQTRPHIIHGKTVDTKRAVAPPHRDKAEYVAPSKQIFVGGVKNHIDEKSLTEYFKEFGKILKVKIPKDKATGRRRGYAYVEFDDFDSADKAILYAPHKIKDTEVDVKKTILNQQDRQNVSGPNMNTNGPQNPPMNNFNTPQPQGYPPQAPNWWNQSQPPNPFGGIQHIQGHWNQGWGNFLPMPSGPMNPYGPPQQFQNFPGCQPPPPQQVFCPPQRNNVGFNQNYGYQQHNFSAGNNTNMNSMANNIQQQQNSAITTNQKTSQFNNSYAAKNIANTNFNSGLKKNSGGTSSMGKSPISNNAIPNNFPNAYNTGNLQSNSHCSFQQQHSTNQNRNAEQSTGRGGFGNNYMGMQENNRNDGQIANNNTSHLQQNRNIGQVNQNIDSTASDFPSRSSNIKRQNIIDAAFERNFQKYVLDEQAKMIAANLGSGYQQNVGGGLMRNNFLNSNRSNREPISKDFGNQRSNDIFAPDSIERKNYERLCKNFDLKTTFEEYVKLKLNTSRSSQC